MKERINASLDKPVRQILDRYCKDERRSRSNMLSLMIEHYDRTQRYHHYKMNDAE